MSAEQSTQLFAQLLWQAVVISGPVLLTLLVVGLAVSVLQVVTQIQEMTLTFIPKLLAAVAVLVLMGPWLLNRLVSYSSQLILSIPRMI